MLSKKTKIKLCFVNNKLLLIFREAFNATKKLFQMGCNAIVLTLGSEGAVYMSKEISSPVHVKSPLVKCVDSTGAGDAFIGALAYLLAYRKKLTIIKQIEIACFVAAHTVTRPGTQMSYPGPEILKL